MSKAAHQHVNQSSGITEYYTPADIVQAAREVMGSITLDPASSQKANESIVQAGEYFTAPDCHIVGSMQVPGLDEDALPVYATDGWGGLDRVWFGNVWLNHPFALPEKACTDGCTKKRCRSRGWHTANDLPGTPHWIDKLVSDYESGLVAQACTITFASISEAWFKALKPYAICLIDGRINYLDPETLKPVNGVTKGSVVTYLGSDLAAFDRVFSRFGEVKFSLGQVMDYLRGS